MENISINEKPEEKETFERRFFDIFSRTCIQIFPFMIIISVNEELLFSNEEELKNKASALKMILKQRLINYCQAQNDAFSTLTASIIKIFDEYVTINFVCKSQDFGLNTSKLLMENLNF